MPYSSAEEVVKVVKEWQNNKENTQKGIWEHHALNFRCTGQISEGKSET